MTLAEHPDLSLALEVLIWALMKSLIKRLKLWT